jgi:uncharacterized protein (TIGR00730 family)
LTTEKQVRKFKNNALIELHFTRTNGDADRAIDELMAMVGGIDQTEIVRELILAALKAGQENSDRADLKLMNSTLKEMRFTSKVFRSYRDRRKVTVFGSARSTDKDPNYIMAKEMGRKLSKEGFMVITGGGSGIMHAVNEGAGAEHSFGVNIRLPFEQKPNPILEGNPRSINYKYFFNRKVAFLKEADAVVLFPGGFGTLDEGMETLTLIQTGKRDPIPVFMVDSPGSDYWKKWLDFLEKRLAGLGFIDYEDLDLFWLTQSIDEVVERIHRFYRRFHSLRYVGDILVIRMLESLPDHTLETIRKQFCDILRPGGNIRPSEALPEEEDEPGFRDLPRLLLDFNRVHFCRLRTLIDAINRDD